MGKVSSGGVTESERLLAQFCQQSFLKLWTYPNPYKDDGKEFCDSIAVFGNDVFVFFDRRSELPISKDKDPLVLWNRWKKNVIDKQIVTAHGAERYLKAGRALYLDGKKTEAFPLNIDPEKSVIHKIIVAHGAKEACLHSSPDNIYGSLGISYTETDGNKITALEADHPFTLILDKKSPVHVLDSHNLSIILGELDTVTDFVNYLNEKTRAIAHLHILTYCGEEDLLANYYKNYDKKQNRHYIGTKDKKINGIMIDQGEWRDFIGSETYSATKSANEISYMWDELIQRTCQNSIDGTTRGNADLSRGPSAIYEMVKEPRFMRRQLADGMMEAIENFPKTTVAARQVRLMPSIDPKSAYVFLQLQLTRDMENAPDVRERRQAVLEIACGAAKNKFPNFEKIVGIGMEPPKYSKNVAEDFILMPCENWPKQYQEHYTSLNAGWNFFETKSLTKREITVNEFVQPKPKNHGKIGRNEKCPCGSEKKHKKCCGRQQVK
ncbi:YecA family protein [Pseudomonas atacamensis]|uniref:YecA family protein n=1 Tax=Pseudomonas atacamensis TaxID=2565368 RepID=UPI001F1C1FE7|nr:SEC-C metal-binding domain-containing protein [Pseudomonas atacamensis]